MIKLIIKVMIIVVTKVKKHKEIERMPIMITIKVEIIIKVIIILAIKKVVIVVMPILV